MIHPTRKEVEKSFKRHRDMLNKFNSKAWSKTHYMVLFYTLECGLKAFYMKQNRSTNTNTTDNWKNSAASYGHDLNKLLKDLHLTPSIPKAHTPNGTQVDVQELHEVWRYGVELKQDDENRCIGILKEILLDLNNQIM